MAADGSLLAVGQTVRINAEDFYIIGIAANRVTVVRGVNGSTASAHAAADSVSVVEYPPDVIETCLQLASNRWSEREAGGDRIGSTEMNVQRPGVIEDGLLKRIRWYRGQQERGGVVFLVSLLKAKTKFTGPLSHGKVRTKKDIIAAANTGLTDLALVGEGYVKKQLYRGHGVQTGHLRASISGGLQKNLVAVVDAGQQLQGRDVIYAGWVETGIRRGRPDRLCGIRNVQGRQGQIKPAGLRQVHRKGHNRKTWLERTYRARSRPSCRRSTTPKYQGVYIGEPRRISEGNRVIAAWYDEEGERTRTMKNAMLWEHWQIRAYWRYVASADVMEDVEREVWTSKAADREEFPCRFRPRRRCQQHGFRRHWHWLGRDRYYAVPSSQFSITV